MGKHEIVQYAHELVEIIPGKIWETKAKCSCGETFWETDQLLIHIEENRRKEVKDAKG